MRLAVAVEVLLLAACAVEWSLPQLAQVGVDVIVVVVGSAQTIREGGCATGAIACPWLAATVACPHQAVLFVVAEVLALTAS